MGGRAEMRIEGIARGVIKASGGTFEIEEASGHRVRIETTEAVVLEPAEIHDGDRVIALCDDDVEWSFEQAKDLRSAPDKKLVRATPLIIAAGDDAEQAIAKFERERKNPKKKKKRTDARATTTEPTKSQRRAMWRHRRALYASAWATFGVAALIAILAGICPWSALKIDLAMFALGAFASAVALISMRLAPRFVRGHKEKAAATSEKKTGNAFVPLNVLIAVPCAVLAVPLINDLPSPWQHAATPWAPLRNASSIATGGMAIWTLALIAIVFVVWSNAAHYLTTLLRAKSSIEGVVRDPTPVTTGGEAAAIVHVIDETAQSGSDPSILVAHVLSAGTFFVDPNEEDEEQSIEVDPKNGYWASSVRIFTKRSNSRQLTQVIPIGGFILITGHRAGKKIKANASDELVFFAVPRSENPRTVARTLLAQRWLVSLVLLLCAGACVGAASYAKPRLPPFHLGGD